MPLVTGKLEDVLWTTKTCSHLNSFYNYIANFCFELSSLTFIPALYTKTLIWKLINWLITKCRVVISHFFH